MGDHLELKAKWTDVGEELEAEWTAGMGDELKAGLTGVRKELNSKLTDVGEELKTKWT